MKKLIIIVILIVAVIASLMPATWLGIRMGFKNPQKGWAADVVYMGARLRMRVGRYQAAAFVLERALRTWPNDDRRDETLYWIGLCYERSGAELLAGQWYERFLEEYPRHRWNAQARRRLDMIEAHNL